MDENYQIMTLQATALQKNYTIGGSNGFMKAIRYTQFFPDPWLRKYVEKIVFFQVDKAICECSLRPFPNGLIEWTILDKSSRFRIDHCEESKLYDSYLIGIFDYQKSLRIKLSTTGEAFEGLSVYFTLNGIQALTGLCPLHFKNRIIQSNQLGVCIQTVGKKIHDFTNKLQVYTFLYQFFKNRFFVKELSNSYSMQFPHFCFQGLNYSAGNLAKQEGISYRSLNRCFSEKVGLTPKEYLKILRIDSACEYIADNSEYNWSDVITQFGYFDQAHFTREFKQMIGTTPTKWIKNGEKGFYFNRSYSVVE